MFPRFGSTALALLITSTVAAGQAASPSPGSAAPGATALPPDVSVARDDSGRATVRAVRLTEPLRLDGQLDERIYGTIPPIDGFLQQVPQEGALATEPTDMW